MILTETLLKNYVDWNYTSRKKKEKKKSQLHSEQENTNFPKNTLINSSIIREDIIVKIKSIKKKKPF